MKIVIFGLTISSSWGNGHATLWRGLCKALARLGHSTVFFEKNLPWYANSRDWDSAPGCRLVLYDGWWASQDRIARELSDADAAIVTSYCPDALAATEEILEAQGPLAVFYDLDTPITLSRLEAGESVPYIGAAGLQPFDLVLSYTGGAALELLASRLGARRVHPLYGHVDPELHQRVPSVERYVADLSYLGTYAADRQEKLESLFVAAARRRPQQRFLIGGAQYPADFPWAQNVYFVRHLAPQEHAAFFSSSRLTLNITREAMAALGWCPSGRLFEASACGATVLSDDWQGLDDFYTPGQEILLARTTEEALAAMDLEAGKVTSIGRRARERTLDQHTSCHRAIELLQLLEGACENTHVQPPLLANDRNSSALRGN